MCPSIDISLLPTVGAVLPGPPAVQPRALQCTGNAHRPPRQHGITLVELIIAVGAFAVLLTLAIPGYRNHAARARISAMVAEISEGKTGAERLATTASHWDYVSDPAAVGLAGPATLCTTIVVDIIASARTAHLYCGGARLEFVALDYTVEEGWQCTTRTHHAAPRNEWAPAGCVPHVERLSP
jgi:Tfp pilus assembly protein PilE